MAVAIACPQCRAVMRSATPIPAGKSIKCPKCAKVFPAPANGAAPGKPSAQGTGGKPSAQGNGARPAASRPSAQGVKSNRPSGQGVAPNRPSATGTDWAATTSARTAAASPKPKGKGGKFKKILVLLLFLTLAGGGLWAYTQFGGSSGEATSESQAAAQPTTAAQAAPPAPKATDDLFAYVPPDCTAFAGIEPAVLLQVPVIKANAETVLKNPELGLLLEELKRLTGLGQDEVERCVIAATGDVNAERPESVVIVARSRTPVDGKKLAQLPDVIETKKGTARPFHTLKSSALTQAYELRACCTPIERLVVVAMGPAKRVEEVMSMAGTAPAAAAELLPILRKAERTQLWAVVPIDAALRQQLEAMLPAAQAMAPDLGDSLKALAQAKAAGFWVGADPAEVRVAAAVLLPSEAAARDLSGGLGVTWTKMKPPLQEMLKPTVQELPGDLRDIIDDVFKSGAVSAEATVAQASLRVRMAPIESLVKVANTVGPQALAASIEQARMKGGLVPGGAPGVGENEKALVGLVNQTRDDGELPKLKPDAKLLAAAAMLAKRAAKDGNFDAVNIEAVQESVKEAGYQPALLTANLAIAPGKEKYDPAPTIQKWMNDEATKNNLLNKEFNECGVGFAMSEGEELFIVFIFTKRP